MPGPVAQGLKEALVETLTGILCPVQAVRAAAEEQVKVLEVTEGECGAAATGNRGCGEGRGRALAPSGALREAPPAWSGAPAAAPPPAEPPRHRGEERRGRGAPGGPGPGASLPGYRCPGFPWCLSVGCAPARSLLLTRSLGAEAGPWLSGWS